MPAKWTKRLKDRIDVVVDQENRGDSLFSFMSMGHAAA
jgi:hypothetical protein